MEYNLNAKLCKQAINVDNNSLLIINLLSD